MKKFAVFDIDGTLYRGSFFADLFEQLVEDGKFSIDYKADIKTAKASWHNREHNQAFREYIDMIVKIWNKHVEELDEATLEKFAARVADNKKGYAYTFTRELAQSLKAEGYFLIAISGSQQELIEPFGKNYGFDISIGEETQRQNGRLIRKIKQTTFQSKHVIIEKLLKEYDLTLEGSYAVGDSFNDVSMLEMVDNPIAFNPEIQLFEEAQKRGWKVVIERKNVIYELEEQSGKYVLAKARSF